MKENGKGKEKGIYGDSIGSHTINECVCINMYSRTINDDRLCMGFI